MGWFIPKPKPPQPPPVKLRTVALVTPGVASATFYVDDVGGHGQHGTCNASGYGEVVVHDYPDLQQTYVTAAAQGYDDYRADAVMLPPGNVQVWLGPGATQPNAVTLPPMRKTPPPLSPLVVSGAFFAQADGTPCTLIGSSDFALYQRYLDGQGVEAILQQRHDCGFNTLRIFGMYNGTLGHFVPADYGDRYFSALPDFFALLARYGFYGEFTAFADTPHIFQGAPSQLQHWSRLCDALRPISNRLLEGVNEGDQANNTLYTDLPQPGGMLCAHGSNGSQAAPVRPWWDYETVHLNSAPEWQRKTPHWPYECNAGADGIAASHVPVWANENTRDDLDGNINHFTDAAAGAALLAAGSCFHSNQGKASTLFTGFTLQCANAWVAGARSVPLEFQRGTYVRRDDLITSGILRVYGRRLPDGREHDVYIRV